MVFKGGNIHEFKGMASNSIIKVRAHNQTCVKTYDHFLYSPYPKVQAGIQLSKRWKYYDFASDTSNAMTHQWFFNQSIVSSAAAFTFDMSALVGDTIKVKHLVISRNNCQDSSVETFIVSDFTALQNAALLSVKIYPNPAKDQLFVEGLPIGSTIELFSIQGQKLMQQDLELSKCSIDLKPFKSGVYWMRIRDQQGATVQTKIIVEE